MFASNPFAELSVSIAPSGMQTYIVVTVVLVAAGTMSRYYRDSGEWEMEKAPVCDVVD